MDSGGIGTAQSLIRQSRPGVDRKPRLVSPTANVRRDAGSQLSHAMGHQNGDVVRLLATLGEVPQVGQHLL